MCNSNGGYKGKELLLKMRMSDKTKKVVAIVIAVVFIFACILPLTAMFVSADNAADKKKELEAQLEEQGNKTESLKNEMENVENEKDDVLAEKQRLDEEIWSLEGSIGELNDAIAADDEKIAEVQIQLDEAQAKYDEQYATFKNRVKVMYESGPTGYLDALLESESLTDFLNRYEVIKTIAEYDKTRTDKLEAAKQEIEAKKQELEGIRQEKVDKMNELENQKATLAQKQQESENYLNQLSQREDELQAYLDKAEQEQAATRAEIAKLAAQIYAQTGRVAAVNYTGGAMEWPAPGYSTITSNYGGRIHPLYRSNNFHRGVDIAAPMGAQIIAANDGVVIRAGYNSSYGYHVIVDHGGGVSTIYAHASALLVSAGQAVVRGQHIANVGSTGASTGAHLHFEVNINGATTDPMAYFN